MKHFLPGCPETGSCGGSVNWLVSEPMDSRMFKSIVPSSSNGITWHGDTLVKLFSSFCPRAGTISWNGFNGIDYHHSV